LVTGLIVGTLRVAAAQAAQRSAPACTVTWTGQGTTRAWTDPKNWSTDAVPGPSSDVCISQFTFALANGSVKIDSLQVGPESTVVFGFTSPGTATIAKRLLDQGNVEVNGTLTAASIDDSGGLESIGESTVTSPALNASGSVSVVDGSLRLTHAPAELKAGTLSGGTWDAYRSVLSLPRDISDISGGRVDIGGSGAAVDDASGHNALAGLSSIGSGAFLAVDAGGSLAISGNLVSEGDVQLGGYADGGGTLTIGGNYTENAGALSALLAGTLSAQSISLEPGSGLDGNGTVNGPVTNDGTVSPAGTLSATGNYVQSAGGTLGDPFGSTLSVGSRATLSGALTVTVNADCPPAHGASFPAIQYGTRSGRFASHSPGFALTVGAHAIDATYEGPSGPGC
jgi:hypothetical protein